MYGSNVVQLNSRTKVAHQSLLNLNQIEKSCQTSPDDHQSILDNILTPEVKEALGEINLHKVRRTAESLQALSNAGVNFSLA